MIQRRGLQLWTFVAACCCVFAAQAAQPLLIRNVNVVTMTAPEVLRDRDVVVRDGAIVSLDPAGTRPAPSTAKVVDGRGKYLMPGLCDMHVHVGGSTVRTLEGAAIAPAIAETQSELLVYLRAGITCVRNMSGSEFHRELIQQIETGQLLGPRTATSTPIVDGDPPVWPFATKVTSPSQAIELVESFKKQGYDSIKVYNGLSRDTYFAITLAARQAGMKVVGHVPFSIGIWGALGAGQYSIEHFRGYDFNPAMAPGASSASDRFKWWFSLSDADLRQYAQATAQAGVFNVPTINLMELAVNGAARDELAKRPQLAELPERIRTSINNDDAAKLFSDDMLQAMRDSLPIQQKLVRYMIEAGAPVLAGTDTPALGAIPGTSLHREIELIAGAGVGNFEALRTATVAPANYFHRQDRSGTVEPGKWADLVLLNANPIENVSSVRGVAGVVLRGEWYSASDLKDRARKLPQ